MSYKKWLNRPHSWSQHSQFRDYSKDEWYNRYILGNKTPITKEIEFGSYIDKRIQTDPNFIPEIPRGDSLQHTITLSLGDFDLVGLFDIYDSKTPFIGEIKTGKAVWDQNRVDKHDQITMYCLLLYLNNQIIPESLTLKLYWLPTEEKQDFSIGFIEPRTLYIFETKRTLKQCLEFAGEIIKIRKEMKKFIHNYKLVNNL